MVILRGVSEESRTIAGADPFASSGAETYESKTLELSCRDNDPMGMP